MSVTNYTLSYVPPPPPAYLPPPTFGSAQQSAAINSLLYDTPRLSQTRQTSYQPIPNRRQPLNAKKIKDNRDPYRNQYPEKILYQTLPTQAQVPSRKDSEDDYDEYYNEPDYETEKKKSSFRKNYRAQVPQTDGYYEGEPYNSNSKTKRKLPTVQQHQQRQSHPPVHQSTQQSTQQQWPSNPPTYKRIANTFNSAPEPGAKTSIHAVLDFDDDFEDYDYEEDDDIEPLPPSLQRQNKPQVTPIEGPIFIKNGSVPVVPLYSYPIVNNGSLVQIPILWTALSLALGLEIHGEIIRGVPCIKRFHQLFCPTAGNSYPVERIESFIDDNKALMKRMYGEFQMSTEYGPPDREIYENRKRNVKRQTNQGTPIPDNSGSKPDSYFARHRPSRQSFKNNQNDSGRVDACESKIEIVTPYWASNSAGKIRAIVNTKHFEQAIHQEVCSKVQTKRCVGDCGCEQKYKWHRLLAYDPDNDCKGIFMDWFLFPSCCVCRCSPTFGN